MTLISHCRWLFLTGIHLPKDILFFHSHNGKCYKCQAHWLRMVQFHGSLMILKGQNIKNTGIHASLGSSWRLSFHCKCSYSIYKIPRESLIFPKEQDWHIWHIEAPCIRKGNSPYQWLLEHKLIFLGQQTQVIAPVSSISSIR